MQTATSCANQTLAGSFYKTAYLNQHNTKIVLATGIRNIFKSRTSRSRLPDDSPLRSIRHRLLAYAHRDDLQRLVVSRGGRR